MCTPPGRGPEYRTPAWREGRELIVESCEPSDDAGDIQEWYDKLVALSAQIPSADHERMAAALAEQKRSDAPKHGTYLTWFVNRQIQDRAIRAVRRAPKAADAIQMVDGQSGKVLSVLRSRSIAGRDEHVEAGGSMKLLQSLRCIAGILREAVIGPSPQP
jgi:hypothetical protein